MNKIYSVILVSVGGALIIAGLSAEKPFGDALNDFFTRAPTSAAIWFFFAGVGLAAVGLYRAWRDRSCHD